jgi:UDP-N-acetylglucosamine:LPS N-acetylglucosamine transferase
MIDGDGESCIDGSTHQAYENIRSAIALVTKPGGMALAESLSAATPAVFLPPFGEHEKQNADLWLSYGFAVSFDAWQRADFAADMLKPSHLNLLKAKDQIRLYNPLV